MGYEIWDIDMGCGMWDMGYGIWDVGYGMWDIDVANLDIDMGYGISIWEMAVSIVLSWISIWDILSLCLLCQQSGAQPAHLLLRPGIE